MKPNPKRPQLWYQPSADIMRILYPGGKCEYFSRNTRAWRPSAICWPHRSIAFMIDKMNHNDLTDGYQFAEFVGNL